MKTLARARTRVSPFPLRLGLLSLLIASALTAACSSDNLLLPGDGEPAHIAPSHGDGQTATVGQALGQPLVVAVTDPAGRPVSDVEVQFVPPAGGILTPTDRVMTDANGEASVNYTLSTTAGDQLVEARAPIVPETNAKTSFRIIATAETPESLSLMGGNGQTAQVNTMLPESLAVRAVDRFGNGVPGIEVTWQAQGGGEVSPETVTTGADGRAATALILGDSPGSYGAEATAASLEGEPIAFLATAVAAPKPNLVLVVEPSTSADAGVPLTQQPEIQLQDPFGAPLTQEGVRVTVQVADGEGSVGGRTTAESDANGRVRFTDLELRGEVGTRTLIFAADGFTPVTSPQIAVRPGPPAAGQSSISAPDGRAGERTNITVRLRDEFGNNIPGAAGDLSISVTGANTTSGIPVTEEGNSYTASYVPVRSGRDEFVLVYRGSPLGATAASSVAPGPADPSTSTVEVTRAGVLFVQVDVVVTTRDAQGNPVGHGGDRVEIIPNGGAPRVCAPVSEAQTCVDKGDGTYVDRFIVVATRLSVGVRLNGVPLAGSPFTP